LLPSGTEGTCAAIKTADEIDLTNKMGPNGQLDWTPPAGDWLVLRIGYSLTGAMNRPASPEATGLEVDKLDAAAIKRYEDHYLGMYRDAIQARSPYQSDLQRIMQSWRTIDLRQISALRRSFRAHSAECDGKKGDTLPLEGFESGDFERCVQDITFIM
jgi:hypothetical protein